MSVGQQPYLDFFFFKCRQGSSHTWTFLNAGKTTTISEPFFKKKKKCQQDNNHIWTFESGILQRLKENAIKKTLLIIPLPESQLSSI